jgi:hypothetical protein
VPPPIAEFFQGRLRETQGADRLPAAVAPPPLPRIPAEPHARRDPVFNPRPPQIEGEIRPVQCEALRESLEDDFSGGLRNWSGDTSGWKLDFAGVRPGGLALFTPSLALRDYRFEFLARIERGGLACAFRAAGPDSHYAVRIDSSGLTRYTVSGGERCDPAPAANPGPIAGKSLDVRISVQGSGFSAEVNGREVDRWNDARLPSGGIGFSAGPEDRVRLYRVKVTPLSPENHIQVPQP